MQLIIGLGNPGSRYSRTRHNFGYWAVDALAHSWNLTFAPGKGDYLIAMQGGSDVALIKPVGGMNNSGFPVQNVLTFYQTAAQDMLVIFDDIDLTLGMLRFRPRGGAGGHQGVASVIGQLGTDDFPRLRLGIATDVPLRPSEKYVLDPFRKKDEPLVTETLEQTVAGVEYYLEHGMEQAMTRFNTRPPE